MTEQLTLSLLLRDDATFDSFYETAKQAEVLANLKHIFADHSEWFFYVWGGSGAGKSHLLQATCHAAFLQNQRALYFPLQELDNIDPSALDDLDELDLICLDDVQNLLAYPAWQESLFGLFNRLKDEGHKRLLIASDRAPRELMPCLPDLQSRLASGVIYHLHELSDEEKQKALQMRAFGRGLVLSDELAQFLMKRCKRNMHDLFSLLDKLDNESLRAQRKLTIPFVKAVLDW